MNVFIFFLAVFIVLVLMVYWPRWRDRRITAQPFPEPWLAILTKQLPVYRALKPSQQERLGQLIQLFIAKKRFVGCGGLTVTDEMRVTIAAEACLLILNQRNEVYPKLYSVLIYPSAFKISRDQMNTDGVVSRQNQHMLGESWSNGKVILSWDDVQAGVEDFNDGQNVVLHEFAHQLDAQSGSTNGAPPLRKNSYGSWSKVLSKDFEQLQWDSLHHHKNTMDYYGATNPAEFFAVATETFFERPEQLHQSHEKLFKELVTYYQTDPRTWS